MQATFFLCIVANEVFSTAIWSVESTASKILKTREKKLGMAYGYFRIVSTIFNSEPARPIILLFIFQKLKEPQN